VPETTDADLRGQMQKLESLLSAIDDRADPATKAQVREIVQSLMDFHGAAIGKIVEAMATDAGEGPAILERLADDELVSSALLLYGLHPLDLHTRVNRALEKVRPYLKSHGGNVDLISINDDGVVRLRMQGSCHGCPSSAITIKTAIETAIYEAAPDVVGLQVDGAAEPASSRLAQVFPETAINGKFALPILKH
jgi:Fe-S cluster biogenesis protein NfuA